MKTLFLLNWRTSILGGGMILAALGDLFVQLGSGSWDQARLGADTFGIVTGLGLIASKDATAK